jgi:hypothetical protein
MHTSNADLNAAIRTAISHAGPTVISHENSHWTACIKDAGGESLGVIELTSHQEVEALAVELARRGYFPVVDDPSPCDFVFAPECL